MHTAAKDFEMNMLSLRITKTPVLNGGTPEQKREEILNYFHATWEIDERLFDPFVDDETFYLRADPLRHPIIFYFGHTAVFYINKLIQANLVSERINPKFESMFAIGVDEMSWDDLNDKHYDWPRVKEVKEYRDLVREKVDFLIRTLPIQLPINWDNPLWAILMGIEHARIHLETSSVLIRQLPIEKLSPNPMWEICPEMGEAPQNELLPVEGGMVKLGKSKDHPLYGWDNEYGDFEAQIPGFSASKFLVSNREYSEFVEDKGYHSKQWWTDEGWSWVQYRQAEHPIFWIKEGTDWKFRTMLQTIDMPWNWPVEVNYLEAKAFCNWKSKRTGKSLRMPTEAEWYLLRDSLNIPDQPYWEKAPGNINLEYYSSSCPVDKFEVNGFYDVIGNVWQWTEMPISGFHGFEVHPFYDDFSTPTFDAKHNLIKGGSWISTGNEATRDSRYAFRRHFFQHAGFRYIESEQKVLVSTNVYETDDLVSQYCEFQYGSEYLGVPNFAKACVDRIIPFMKGRPMHRALDIGCATGRASFELAKYFDSVTGLDFSARFIRIGTQLKEKGSVHYTRVEEGELVSFHEKSLEEFDLYDVRNKVDFYQADASNLLSRYTGYNLVFGGNLIDRLYNPQKFLRSIHERIVPGGMLVLTSPYTWLEEYTEKKNWVGGFRKDGEPFTTLDGLKEILEENFELVNEPFEIPFVIRETKRKYQHTFSEMTIWARKSIENQ